MATENTNVMLRAPLQGTVKIAIYGKLVHQLDDADEPQFLVTSADNGVALVFYTKDVDRLTNYGADKTPQIFLKKPLTPDPESV